jgi:type II secretion system protein C
MDEKRFITVLWVAKAALLVVLAYVAFEVATSRLRLVTMFDPGTASGQPQATDTQVAAPETRNPSDYGEIVARNLFTDADGPTNPQAAVKHPRGLDSLGSAQELGLRLIGTIAGGSIASRAVIQDTRNNATSSYRIGDMVASATVQAIRRDAVILQYQGRPLLLKLQAGTAADHPSKALGPGDRNDPDKDKPVSAKDPAAAGGKDAQTTPPQDQAGSVMDIFRKATIEPYVRNDQTEGLQITGLENMPMAELIGLRNGDVVQSVNGQQLTSKQKAFQVLMKAKTQSKIDIQLLRDGQNRNLSFNL